MADHQEETINIISQHQVFPSKPTNTITSLPLTFFDLIYLQAGPVHRLFFFSFPHSTSHFLSSSLPTLLSNLSHSLHLFPPLSSHLSLSSTPLQLISTPTDSIPLTISEFTGDPNKFHYLISDHPKPCSLFKPLLPLLPSIDTNKRSLMALQVTIFPFHGLCLAMAIDHVVGDGASFNHFRKSFATGSLVGAPPVFDRTLIPDPSHKLYSTYLNFWHNLKSQPQSYLTLPQADEDNFIATFTLRREHIEKLKLKQIQCTTFVVSCAYVWVCMAKANAWPGERTSYFLFAFDCRARLRPPLSLTYFGNCLLGCCIELKVKELVGEDGVTAAAKAIKAGIEDFEERGVLSDAEGMMEKLRALPKDLALVVAGSPRFRVYETEFEGWGKPVKVDTVLKSKSRALCIAESRDGEGGVEIGLVLSLPLMNQFTSCFDDGLRFI
ncbi:Transferase protein [Dioscorea alata]|uniref:Transferase protein n=1 Tax=Dioscorea alata TaxID=55571 RepID=A0ACB7WTC1_DIOAL|nr:Transferase protein [Dioscorea alata]